jgi:hypothetical protein
LLVEKSIHRACPSPLQKIHRDVTWHGNRPMQKIVELRRASGAMKGHPTIGRPYGKRWSVISLIASGKFS